MDSHIRVDLNNIKHYFEKLLATSVEEDGNNEESVYDHLVALEKVEISPSSISQMGNVVNKIKNRFQKVSKIESKAKALLLEWKRIKTELQQKQKSPSKDVSSDPHTARKNDLLKESAQLKFQSPSATKQVEVNTAEIESKKASLHKDRLAMVRIFTNTFIRALSEPRSQKLSLDIEEEVNVLFSYESAKKDYVAKARALKFNLDKNEMLFNQVMSGEIDLKHLVGLSDTELATPDVKLKRAELSELNADSRATNWFKKHEKEIKQNLGIDPENSWEYDNEDDRLSEPDADAPDI